MTSISGLSAIGVMGFSPTPLPATTGAATPTLVAQPFYRELQSVSFTHRNNGATNTLPIVEFMLGVDVFLAIACDQAVDPGIVAKCVFAQRVNGHSASGGSLKYSTTSLPAGIYVEPNVTVRIRIEAGAAGDTIEDIVMMLAEPSSTDPRARR